MMCFTFEIGWMMRRFRAVVLIVIVMLAGCGDVTAPTALVPDRDAPFPATWTPTPFTEDTPTATLVVQPTPTWDGTPPPPSAASVPRVLPARLDRALQGEPLRGEAAVTVIDVRTLAAYEQARIPGALHIPLEGLAGRVGELDGNDTIVFYALSLDEAQSLDAAMVLYDLGFTDVVVLEGGIQRWYAEGYAIEGTWLTPTPQYAGPPWTVTPITSTTTLATAVMTVTLTQAVAGTPVQATHTPAATATATATAAR
jgi:rhodanese-related sulfurtransferase